MAEHNLPILVVEDDAIVRMLIVDVLEELEFSVLEADEHRTKRNRFGCMWVYRGCQSHSFLQLLIGALS